MSNLIYNYVVKKTDGTVEKGQFNWLEITSTGQVYHGNNGKGDYPVIASFLFEDIEGSEWSHVKEDTKDAPSSLLIGCTDPYRPCP